MEECSFSEKLNTAKNLKEKMDLLEKSAEIDSGFSPLTSQGRLSKVIQRLKEEYKFSKPDYKIDSTKFEKLSLDAKERVLYDNLCNAVIEDGAIRGVDMTFCGNDGWTPIILRRCYFDLFEVILNSLHIPAGNHWSLILGSSGIGKSWFLVFCLYVLIKADVPVFFKLQDYSALVYKGEVYIPLANSELFDSSNMWFLYDRDEPPRDISTTNVCVMVTKVKRAVYKKYKKTSSFPPLFMPTWDFDELELKNSFLPVGKRLTEDQLEEHETHCGGIPRNVFTCYYTITKLYKDALNTVTMKHVNVYTREDDMGGWTDTNWEDFEGLPERIFGLQVYENYFRAVNARHNRSMCYDVATVLMSRQSLNMFLGTKF